MRDYSRFVCTVLATATLMMGGPAFAHAELTAATPASNSKAANIRTLSLRFSQKLVAAASGVEIVMTSMPGMTHHAPMKVSGFKTALDAEGKVMTITLPRALPAGTYDVKWHAGTADSHRVEGSYSFTAR